MPTQTETITAHIFPGIFYRDANAAIDWLERAFGFKRLMVVPAGDGAVAHAELRLGNGVIMVGTAGIEKSASPLDAGAVTQSTYVYVPDAEVDAHYRRAKAAGAEVTRELAANEGYAGRGYSARDPEGHNWSFGSYMPEDPARM